MSANPKYAFVHWILESSGGRRAVPGEGRYSTVARFEDDETWPHVAWSVVINNIRSYRDGRLTYAEVKFLVDEAPAELLRQGSRFELLEGKKRVAKGVVLPIAVAAPNEVNDLELALIGS